MKKMILLLSLTCSLFSLYAQKGMGTTTPNPAAVLELSRPPRGVASGFRSQPPIAFCPLRARPVQAPTAFGSTTPIRPPLRA